MVVWNRLPKSWKLGEKWRYCTVECDEITSRHTKHANRCKRLPKSSSHAEPCPPSRRTSCSQSLKETVAVTLATHLSAQYLSFCWFRRPRPSKDARLTFKTHDFMFEKKSLIARQGIDTIEPLFPTAIIHSYFILPIPITHSELVWYLVDRNAKW